MVPVLTNVALLLPGVFVGSFLLEDARERARPLIQRDALLGVVSMPVIHGRHPALDVVQNLAHDEAGDAAAAAYGSNYLRLRKLKTKHDPSNFFHMNQNIPPMS